MLGLRSFAAGTLVLACTVSSLGCKKEDPGVGQTVHFSKVPLNVDIPPGWSQSLNTSEWLMYRPDDGGALLAMSGEKSCSVVEKRVYGALLGIGLSEVTWKGAPRQTQIHGLLATVAEGEATEGTQRAGVKYAIIQAPERRGCVLALVSVWHSKDAALGKVADEILQSVHADE